jgi:Fic family protein
LGETKTLVEHGLTAAGKPMRDARDILGHNDVIKSLPRFIAEKRRLNEVEIKNMHSALLQEPYDKPARSPDGTVFNLKVRLGEYKKERNIVTTPSGETHEYVHPEEVPAQMYNLLEWHRERDRKRDLHVIEHASLFHHRFVAIHPFDDGNGRMGRILMNLILMEQGFPPAIIRFEERNQYVAALVKADAGEPKGLVEFIAQKLIDSETLYLRGAQGESVEDVDDVDKELALLKRELAQVEEPLEVTEEKLSQLIGDSIGPLILLVAEKLRQFDELFSTERLSISTQVTNRENNSRSGGPWLSGKKTELKDWLSKLSPPMFYSELSVNFSWEGFKKAGLNDFGWNISMQFLFERRKYTVEAQQVQFRRQLMYQQRLSEDGVREIVSKLTKLSLEQIQNQLSKQQKS